MGDIGVMEKEMETTGMMGILEGLYRDYIGIMGILEGLYGDYI